MSPAAFTAFFWMWAFFPRPTQPTLMMTFPTYPSSKRTEPARVGMPTRLP